MTSSRRVEASYRRVHPRLWRAVLAYSGDSNVASDAVAEAFTQALRRGEAIDDVDRWVWRTAFAVAGGLLQRRATEPVTAVAIEAADPEQWSTAEFVSQLQLLSNQQRQVVVLRYVGGFTPTEIAAQLSTTAGTVRVQLRRAHQSLRAQMEALDDDR